MFIISLIGIIKIKEFVAKFSMKGNFNDSFLVFHQAVFRMKWDVLFRKMVISYIESLTGQ